MYIWVPKKLKEQFHRVGSLLLPSHGVLGLNLGQPTCRAAILPAHIQSTEVEVQGDSFMGKNTCGTNIKGFNLNPSTHTSKPDIGMYGGRNRQILGSPWRASLIEMASFGIIESPGFK